MFLGGLIVFLTPSQLYIVKDLMDKLLLPTVDSSSNNPVNTNACGGKPMNPRDFDRIEHQLQSEMDNKDLWRTDFATGM
jgi:hypothetical protein